MLHAVSGANIKNAASLTQCQNKFQRSELHYTVLDVNVYVVLFCVSSCILPMAMGANKVETKSRHRIHMASEVDLEVDMEALPAEPRRSCDELFLSQLSVPDTIQPANQQTDRICSLDCLITNKLRCLISMYWTYLYKVHTVYTPIYISLLSV